MKFSKALVFSTVLAAGATLAFGASDANADETYTVKPNDSLSKISMKFVGDNSLVNKIAEDNDIENSNIIFAGTQLTIATDGSSSDKAPKQESAPVQQEAPKQESAPKQTSSSKQSSGESSSAKAWIANKESTNSYSARNGRYIGKYQLDSAYLNGDHSPANQEKVADQYVNSRYGGWDAAKTFWQANGWY
ncbi:LysM domain-containing protein [Tetragenococcus halophilus]|uniref:aggregation-promoting factor n=1 Tax=Tetragenococcus halophilus TaxID=51669 RepID=UPI001F46FE8E|nr:LysM domain-containing protein [Tetragenococcus halophilus]MCF1684993.1 LysM domain-containing protein [Tetragenococcus halophilus]